MPSEWKMKLFPKEIEITGLYTLFYFEHDKDFYFAGERHDFWEMVYVDVGEISVVAENAGYAVRQGEAVFHKPNEFHTLASNKKNSNKTLIITFAAAGEAVKFFENKIFSLNAALRGLLAALLLEAQAAFDLLSVEGGCLLEVRSGAPAGAPQMILNYLERFLLELVRGGESGDRSARKSPDAKRNAENALALSIECCLAENVCARLSLDDVCQKFHMSKSYICRLFKEATGESVVDFHIRLKIEEAKRLLSQGGLNCSQIAEKLGYSSVHHFCRSFKKAAGAPPGAYARQSASAIIDDPLREAQIS
jgi:AraC-like DNA-binding protein